MNGAKHDIRESYDRLAPEYARRISGELRRKPLDRQLLDRLAADIGTSGEICDIGCGPGHVARYLRDAGANVFGLDLSPKMLEEARRLNPDISFRLGDMLALDVPSGTLAGIVAFYAIVNIPEQSLHTCFAEMLRVLRPGGLLLLAFHAGPEVIREEILWDIPISMNFYLFDPLTIRRHLEDAGFTVDDVIEREPYASDVEYQSRRAYIFARKAASLTLCDAQSDEQVAAVQRKSTRQIRLSSPTRGFPERIVCLSDETTETLYMLGEQDRIVGVSGFTTRPAEARSKPKISTFNNANYDSILNLRPDLVLTFSDVQAEITRQLVLRGITVFNFNQRSVAEIFDMVRVLSRIVGRPEAGLALIARLRSGLEQIASSAKAFPHRPRVFFEEWKEPLVSGIEWVEELVEIAGGEPVFPELRKCARSKDRIVDPAAVVERNPDIIIASWCGMKADKEEICSRPGWSNIAAVQHGFVYELRSSYILQPGPAALTCGVRHLHAILARTLNVRIAAHIIGPDVNDGSPSE